MTDPAGGFYSAQDADSEMQEGKYYLWNQAEIRRLLGEPDATAFSLHYGVTPRGNFQGENILHTARDLSATANRLGVSADSLWDRLTAAGDVLLRAREGRERPALDDKVLAGWNGQMLAAFAEAGKMLARPDYLTTAEANAQFLMDQLWTGDRLHRTWRKGKVGSTGGFLEDYAFFIDGLLALYGATWNDFWYRNAVVLSRVVWEHFRDPEGGFFDTPDDHEELIVRPKHVQDNVLPSGNAQMAETLLRLALYGGDADDDSVAAMYRSEAERMLAAMSGLVGRVPTGFGYWLCAVALALSEPATVAVVGRVEERERRQMLESMTGTFRPFEVVAVGTGKADDAAVPLLRGRRAPTPGATAYVCRGTVCFEPMTDAGTLSSLLADMWQTESGRRVDEA
jgi:uncharacterized protein